MKEEKICVVIPARYESTRLPGKPLIEIAGKAMIHRVYDQVSRAQNIDQVIIATDDDRILDFCKKNELQVMMTKKDHPSGTDRIAEVASQLDFPYFINVQGDEPMISPYQIDELAKFMIERKAPIATQIKLIEDEAHLFDFNIVKVVTTKNGKALYFSRQAIPAQRDLPFRQWMDGQSYFRHIGMYGFSRSTLLEVARLPESSLEKSEKLEQLRWMEAGYDLYCSTTKYDSIGVDTQADVERVEELITSGKTYQR